MTSAQIDQPPSPVKRDLIRRFLHAAGIQRRLDSGSFLDVYAAPGRPLFEAAARNGATLADAITESIAALRQSYEKHRHVWQEEYESHVNWEFADAELMEIVAFLEGEAGQHFLEGRWRMDAYIGTNTEALIEEIIKEAEAALAGPPGGG